MEIENLRFQPAEVPPHTDVTSLVISLFCTPPLESHSIESSERTRSICTSAAMEENRIACRVIHQFEIFCDGARGNLRPWLDFVHRDLDVIHPKFLDDRLF